MNDLAMIDVELKLQVRKPQLLDQIAREAEIVEEVTGDVAGVYRLEHDVDTVRREEFGGPRHRFVEGLNRDALSAVGNAGHQVQALDAGGLSIRPRRLQAPLDGA